MTREMTYYCEEPKCENKQTSASEARPITGWLLVVMRLPTENPYLYDFCSWDCLMKYAASLDPPEEIEWETMGREKNDRTD